MHVSNSRSNLVGCQVASISGSSHFAGWVCFGVIVMLFAGLVGFGTPGAYAQASIDQLLQQQDLIQRREDERRRALEEERKRREMELSPPEDENGDQSPAPAADGRCAEVQSVLVTGNSLLSDDTIGKITEKYQNRCLDLSAIDQLLGEINGLYRENGYITSRAYIEQQDLSDGILRVVIIEGRIEEMRLNENDQRDRLQLFFAFPAEAGDLLNLRDIEQGLDQMNRLRSNAATMQILPGEEIGTSVIQIVNTPSRMIYGSLGRDNTGVSSTGKLQDKASVTVENVLGFNDQWNLNAGKNARDHDDRRRSERLSFFGSVPYGYWTLSYLGSYSSYESTIEGAVQTFSTSGQSTTHKAEVSWIAHRDDVSKTRVDTSVTAKRYRNYVEDTLVQVNSRDLTVGRAAIAHSRRLADSLTNIELGYERGLRMLGALKDRDELPETAPRAQFGKWTADASVYWPFQLGQNRLSYSLTTRWQYADDTLFGTERIGIGGPYTVRGFRDDTLAGDVGGYARNEIAWRLPPPELGILAPFVGRIEPYLAFDWGWIRPDGDEFREQGVLRSWSIGMRNVAEHSALSVEFSKPVSAPAFLKTSENEVTFSLEVLF